MAQTSYFVIGGEYADTRFDQIADGGEEERHGPFETYKDAREAWAKYAWETVDNCYARYRIIDAAGAAVDDPPARM